MNGISVWTYPLVFFSVFVTYLVVSFCMGTSPVDKRVGGGSMPLMFRLARRYIDGIAVALFGSSFETTRPRLHRKYTALLLMAGFPLVSVQLYAAQIFCLAAGGGVCCFGVFVLSGEAGVAFVLGGVAALLGWVYPVMLVRQHAQKRQIEIIRALPFAIDLLASAMQSGLDFIAAVRYYVMMGGKGALVVEFGLLLRKMEMGRSRLEALEEMATHVQTQEFSAFVGAVAHGTEVGASIIDTLRIQGEDMRRARFNLAERKAARAPSIMIFPIAIFILPAVFTIIGVPVIMRFKAAKGGA